MSDVERTEVTDELQAEVIKRELLKSTSPLHFTAGMRRALRERHKSAEPRAATG